MFSTFFWLLFGFYCLAFGFLCSLAASQKKRDPGGWFVIGMLFGIFGLVAALIIDPVAGSTSSSDGTAGANSSNSATCPFCAETIKREACVCRYCGRDLASDWAASQVPSACDASESGTADAIGAVKNDDKPHESAAEPFGGTIILWFMGVVFVAVLGVVIGGFIRLY